MNNDEKRLSDYIDSLNQEKQPKEHKRPQESSKMEELLDTVRWVKRLKEPAMPKEEYFNKLTSNLSKELQYKEKTKKVKRRRVLGVGSIAAILIFSFLLTFTFPLGQSNVVQAMEKAFQRIAAYHGTVEIVETSANGQSTTQGKLEVWADKQGRYFVKNIQGWQKGLITANDGQHKWQIQPKEKQVNISSAFPDLYKFTFELGKEIDQIKGAIKIEKVGKDTIAGRPAIVMEITPQGGTPYKIWVDQETNMPLQKQAAMDYGVQYRVTYKNIKFIEEIPKDILTYHKPQGFKEVQRDSAQSIHYVEEAQGIVGFFPSTLKEIPKTYIENSIIADKESKIVEIEYVSKEKGKNIILRQRKTGEEFKPASTAALGKINNHIAEIQAPVESETRILGGGLYSDINDINSIRWQKNDVEYTFIGNTSLEELTLFIQNFTKGQVELFSKKLSTFSPKVEIPIDLEVEKGDQKNADSGHSPWKLDPLFVAQVFVSLDISPKGIEGDYPVKLEQLRVLQNNGQEAIIEINNDKTSIQKVYLKKLIRQDATGIWTVVGYDQP